MAYAYVLVAQGHIKILGGIPQEFLIFSVDLATRKLKFNKNLSGRPPNQGGEEIEGQCAEG